MRKPCCEGKNKGSWTKQEDEKLTNYIRTHGEGCWRTLPKEAGLLFFLSLSLSLSPLSPVLYDHLISLH